MKNLVLSVLICMVAFTVKAQTKGTNVIGLGFQHQSVKNESGGVENSKQTRTNYSLTYGNFIRDNSRLSFTFSYSHQDNQNISKVNNYGGSVDYQRYYPLLKKFYAFASGGLYYTYGKSDNTGASYNQGYKSYSTGISANGGAAYFLSKHLAFEADLLSAGFSYQRMKTDTDIAGVNGKTTSTSFDISSSGAITDLGFRIYFLF